MPDGSAKEGYFKNNIFYGDSSPRSSEKSFGYAMSPNKERRNVKSSISNFSQNSHLSRDLTAKSQT